MTAGPPQSSPSTGLCRRELFVCHGKVGGRAGHAWLRFECGEPARWRGIPRLRAQRSAVIVTAG